MSELKLTGSEESKKKFKFSIITVSLNSEKTIEKTISSVINQKYPHIEYIVIDGNSKDNTMEIIQKYKSSIDLIINEADDGIYYAMNKGLKKAKGDIIYFLNSGDCLFNEETINFINNSFIQNPHADIIYGDIIEYNDFHKQYISMMRKNLFHIIAKGGICHQSIFAKVTVFESNNSFDTKYRIYADYDWLINSIRLQKIDIKHINTPVVCYKSGGQSQQNVSKYFIERIEIINKNIKYFSFKTLFFRDFRQVLYFIAIYIYLYSNYIFYKIKCSDGR